MEVFENVNWHEAAAKGGPRRRSILSGLWWKITIPTSDTGKLKICVWRDGCKKRVKLLTFTKFRHWNKEMLWWLMCHKLKDSECTILWTKQESIAVLMIPELKDDKQSFREFAKNIGNV